MTCPICKKPTDPHYRPFCCRRCADVDLAKWLGNGYAIPGGATREEETPPAPDRDPPLH